MKANEFTKEHGLEKVRSIINKYPNYTHSTDDARMFVNEHDCIEHIKKDLHTCVRFDDLKHLIESHDLMGKFGGLKRAKRILNKPYKSWSSMVSVVWDDKPFQCSIIALEQAITDVEGCQ